MSVALNGTTGELVMLTPAAGAPSAADHWLLALWRGSGGELRTAALFQCRELWMGGALPNVDQRLDQ